jgi:uncharacterized repeat protein (TIGR01451 family)
VVQPNSNYFANWVFQNYTSTPPTSPIRILPGDSNTDLSLAGRTLTATNNNANAADVFNMRPPAGFAGGTDAGFSTGNNPGDDALFMFNQPLPSGSVLFVNDVDAGEATDLKFLDCSGNLVDAGNFTLLRLSTITAPDVPPTYTIQGTGPNRYFNVTGTDVNVSNTTDGILIQSGEVCGVESTSTSSGTGGLIAYWFGAPENAPYLNVNKSVASIDGSTSQTRVSQPQDTVAYTIKVSNPQTVDTSAEIGTISETLPAGVTFVSSSDFDCSTTPCTNTSALSIPAGGSVNLSITVKVDSTLNVKTTPSLTNTVGIVGVDCSVTGNLCSVSTLTSPPTVSSVPATSPWTLALLAALLSACAYAFRRARVFG